MASQENVEDVIERMARAIAEASDDGCFVRIDAGEADDSTGDWEDADYYRRLARAAHGAAFSPGSTTTEETVVASQENEIDLIRQAVAEMDDEWSQDRAMGQDRTEWGTWRALIGWLNNVADRMPYADDPTPEQSHAVHIACTYLGLIDPRDRSANQVTSPGGESRD